MTKRIVAILTLLIALTSAAAAQGARPISQIEIRILTGDRPAAGTNDLVYLGLAGREFRIEFADPARDDFGTGSDATYTLGMGSNVAFSELNDPLMPQLTTRDVESFPVYIRKSADLPEARSPNWNVEEVRVTINPGLGQIIYTALEGPDHLWLSNQTGLILYLKRR